MRKIKLLSVFLCCIILVGVGGCSSGDTSSMFDDAPWSEQGSACTETCVYEFSRYLNEANPNPEFVLEGEDIAKGYKLTSSGSLTYVIKEGVSLEMVGGRWTEVANSHHTLIKMDFSVTYKNDLNHTSATIHSLYAGKTDSMLSYAVLDRYTLNSLFTYKQTETQTQAEGDTKDYTLTADYTGEFTGTRRAVVKDNLGESTLSIKAGEYYDSESIYYQVRAMGSVQTEGGGTRAFSLALPYNDTLDGLKKLKVKSAKQTTAADKTQVELSLALRNFFAIPQESDTAETTTSFNLDCFQTALALTTKKPGPDINLYYSAYPIRVNNKDGRLVAASKVLIKIEYPNHDQFTNAIYNQEYVLTSYSNSN